MNPVLVAHGTRKGSGVAMIGELAEQVSGLLDRRVHTAFVDVLGPNPAEVLSGCRTARPSSSLPSCPPGTTFTRTSRRASPRAAIAMSR